MRQFLTAAAVAAALGLAGQAGAAFAQASGTSAPASQEAVTTNFATVSIGGKEIMRLTDAGGHSARSRAKEVDTRLRQVLESEPGEKTSAVKPSDVTVQKSGNLYVVRLRDANVITATFTDAKLKDMTPQALAEQWASNLRDAISGIHVTAQENLPADFVTIATGQITMPAGGGAGTGVQDKDKEKANNKDKTKPKANNKDKTKHTPDKAQPNSGR